MNLLGPAQLLVPVGLRGIVSKTNHGKTSARSPLNSSCTIRTSHLPFVSKISKASSSTMQAKPNPSSPTPTPLQALAARITAHADALAAAATTLSHPHRSLLPTPTSPATLLPPTAPASARAEQVALRDALTEASILATDATEFVPDLAVRNNQLACLRWLSHFDIPNLLPLEPEGPTTQINPSPSFRGLPYSTVSNAARVPEHQLRSIARMAILAGFLCEQRDSGELLLCHSPLSAATVRQPALLEWLRFVTGTSAPMVPAMVEATEQWGRNGSGIDRDGSFSQTAYAVAWKTDLPLFAHVASNPDLEGRYAAYMAVMTHSEGMALGHLIDGWREGWTELARKEGVLIDVGGSAGNVGRAVVDAFPGIKVVVQDRPEVVSRALGMEDVEKRTEVTFQAHDFFLPQPERPSGFGDGKGYAVYLLRQILHDWDDDRAVVILRHLAGALERAGPGARLVVMDTVLPPSGGGESRTEEALLRVRDLTMMQAHNAHERSMDEWEKLVTAAHENLTIEKVIRPFKSLMAVIEISIHR